MVGLTRQMEHNRRRVVITTSGEHVRRVSPPRSRKAGPREWVTALVVIGAAALATFLALFLTSRPYDPMNSTVQPQQSVPQGQLQVQASPTPSPSPAASAKPNASVTPEATNEPASAPPDDATVQQEIEHALRSDSALADLDISTIVEGGRVTIVGSVRSVELKQRVVRVVRGIKGVSSIDNQLVVIEPTP